MDRNFQGKQVFFEYLNARISTETLEKLEAVAGKRGKSRFVRDLLVKELDKAAPSVEATDIKTILLRVNEDGWKELRRLSIEVGEPMDSLLIHAANHLLECAGKPPCLEKRLPRKAKQDN